MHEGLPFCGHLHVDKYLDDDEDEDRSWGAIAGDW